jgi:hypothetical protein
VSSVATTATMIMSERMVNRGRGSLMTGTASQISGLKRAGIERRRSMGWFALVGFVRGLMPFLFCWPLLLLAPNATSLPLATFAIVNPLVCAGVGCLCHRYPAARRWRTPSFFAIEPLTARERQERSQRLSTFVWAGFGMGIVTALAATSLEVACRGLSVLDFLIPALLIYPWLGAYAGFIFGLRPGDPKPSIRRLRVSLRTSMILVAYIALLFGLGTQADDRPQAPQARGRGRR